MPSHVYLSLCDYENMIPNNDNLYLNIFLFFPFRVIFGLRKLAGSQAIYLVMYQPEGGKNLESYLAESWRIGIYSRIPSCLSGLYYPILHKFNI